MTSYFEPALTSAPHYRGYITETGYPPYVQPRDLARYNTPATSCTQRSVNPRAILDLSQNINSYQESYTPRPQGSQTISYSKRRHSDRGYAHYTREPDVDPQYSEPATALFPAVQDRDAVYQFNPYFLLAQYSPIQPHGSIPTAATQHPNSYHGFGQTESGHHRMAKSPPPPIKIPPAPVLQHPATRSSNAVVLDADDLLNGVGRVSTNRLHGEFWKQDADMFAMWCCPTSFLEPSDPNYQIGQNGDGIIFWHPPQRDENTKFKWDLEPELDVTDPVVVPLVEKPQYLSIEEIMLQRDREEFGVWAPDCNTVTLRVALESGDYLVPPPTRPYGKGKRKREGDEDVLPSTKR